MSFVMESQKRTDSFLIKYFLMCEKERSVINSFKCGMQLDLEDFLGIQFPSSCPNLTSKMKVNKWDRPVS